MKSTKDNFKKEGLKWKTDADEEVKNVKGNPEHYAGVYGELAEILSDAQVVKIWKRFAGVNVTFPQRLLSKEYTNNFIKEHLDDMTASEMARAVGLSERRVRQIASELKKERE